jgi:hypothetical protein
VGLGPVIFAQVPVAVSAGGIEIAKVHVPNSMRNLEIAERFFEGALRSTVWTHWTLRMRLDDRQGLWLPVDRTGRRKNDGGHVIPRYGIEEHEPPTQIVPVIHSRIAHRFAHVGATGKMKNNVNLLALKNAIEFFPGVGGVRKVGHHQFRTHDGLAMSFAQVVEDHDPLASIQELTHSM